MSKTLIIIPARKGSKGLKNKNKKIFNGKPLYQWPIIAAIESKIADTIVLSTNDDEIIKMSRKFKDKIKIIKRPKKLSLDTSSSYEYIIHTLQNLNKEKLFYSYLIVLEPTSPLTDKEDIKSVYKALILKNNTSIVSVQKNIKCHPDFNYTLSKNQNLKALNKQTNLRRQDISKVLYLDGSIYASRVSSFIKYKSFIQKKTKPYFPKLHKFIEIDDKFDFELAEIIKKYYGKKKK